MPWILRFLEYNFYVFSFPSYIKTLFFDNRSPNRRSRTQMAGWWVGQLWMMGRPTLWHGWNPTPIDRLCGCFSLDFWSFTSFHNCFHRPCPIVLDDGAGTFRGAQLTLPTALSPFRPLREPWLLTLYIPKQLQLNGTASSIDNAMSLPPPQTPQRKNWRWRFAIKSLCY